MAIEFRTMDGVQLIERGVLGRRLAHALVPVLLLWVELGGAPPVAAQGVPLAIEDMPLAQNGAVKRGGTVTPVYEGWYQQPDGSFMVYFGYYNRNTEEVVEIPMGPANAVDGPSGGSDAGQPKLGSTLCWWC